MNNQHGDFTVEIDIKSSLQNNPEKVFLVAAFKANMRNQFLITGIHFDK